MEGSQGGLQERASGNCKESSGLGLETVLSPLSLPLVKANQRQRAGSIQWREYREVQSTGTIL